MSQLVQLPSNNNQAKSIFPPWVLYRSAAYLGGRGITFGDAIVPHLTKAIGNASLNFDIYQSAHVDVIDTRTDFIALESLKHVFVGPRLAMLDNPIVMMKNLVSRLQVGGHLVMAQKLMDTKARFYWNSEGVTELVRDSGARFVEKARYERDGLALHIYKKIHGKKGIEPSKPRSGKPRACIARYGALGDMIMITPLIHQLHDDGYEVTMNVSPYCLPVLDNNPYVSNYVIQEREMIPNPELGPYWKEWEGDYERYINLSESLEGRYLKVEGRRDFYTTKEWRIKTGERNYYDATMRFGGYPDAIGRKGELFFSNAERRDAKKFYDGRKEKFVILWAMNGSSHHKIYPNMELVCSEWLQRHPDSIIVTVGDAAAKQMEFEHNRLLKHCGNWSIRESLAAIPGASLVVGPETMMTNAAGSLGTPVITLLSHSTHEALCKHWGSNDYCLAPENTPCYPCFQLHYSPESCPLKQAINAETKEVLAEAPACALDGISPQRLLARMEEVYSQQVSQKCGKMELDGSQRQMVPCTA